jgi:tetratricopeptide (TPR) repeat protein
VRAGFYSPLGVYLTFPARRGSLGGARMKKILILVAAIVLLDVVALVVLGSFAWRPLVHFVAMSEVRVGKLRNGRSDFTGGIECFDRALAMDPNNVDAYVGRAYSNAYLGRYDDAIADGDHAISIDAASGNAYGARAWAKEWKGDLDGAHADYDQAIKLSPNQASFYAHRGAVRDRQKEHEGALKDLDHALELNPSLAFAYHDRATFKYRKGDTVGAIQDEDSAVEFAPRKIDYLLRRANYHLRTNDLEDAAADVSSAQNLQPGSASAYYLRAVIQRRQGNTQDALKSLDQALQIDPSIEGGYFERGIVKYVAGDLKGAEADFRLARANAADRPHAEIWLWIITSEQGSGDEANRVLGDYLTDARNIKDGTWTEKLGDLVLGRLQPDALAASIDLGQNESLRKDEICEVWFFAGKMELLKNDRVTARTDFQTAVATGAADILEFSESQRELAKL